MSIVVMRRWLYLWCAVLAFLVLPCLAEPAGGVGDDFGTGVALDGNWLAVGAPAADPGGALERGLVRMFVRDGGHWVEHSVVLSSDGQEGDEFGVSVALSGNRLVVGAVSDDRGTVVDLGAAYLFEFDGAAWAQRRKFDAAGFANTNDGYGRTVAVSSDTIAVGAPQDEADGVVYVYRERKGVWDLEERLPPPSSGSSFGGALALQNDTLLVGQSGGRIDLNFRPGRAHVFVRSGSDWLVQESLAGSGNASDGTMNFGRSVALDGDLALIGAPAADSGRGVAFVYRRTGGDWNRVATLARPELAAGDAFGRQVALAGDAALATAFSGLSTSAVGYGTAFAFNRIDDQVWTPGQSLTTPLVPDWNRYGVESVAMRADRLVISEIWADIGGDIDHGAVHSYDRTHRY